MTKERREQNVRRKQGNRNRKQGNKNGGYAIMGGGIKTGDERIVEIVVADGNETGGGSTTGTSATDTAAGSGGNSTGGRGTGGSGGNAETEKTVVSELAILSEEERKQYEQGDDDEKKRLIRNAKRRQRYAKQKTDNGQSVKPRKVNKKSTTKSSDEIDRTQINAVVGGLSTAIASRPNCSHWQLTNEEIDSITKPLCAMLKESELFEKTMEHSNEIALVTACLTVFAPRVFVTVMQQKQEREKVKNVKTATGKNKETVKRNDTGNAIDNANNGTDGTWYGSAIY
jgi:hypothetical protein